MMELGVNSPALEEAVADLQVKTRRWMRVEQRLRQLEQSAIDTMADDYLLARDEMPFDVSSKQSRRARAAKLWKMMHETIQPASDWPIDRFEEEFREFLKTAKGGSTVTEPEIMVAVANSQVAHNDSYSLCGFKRDVKILEAELEAAAPSVPAYEWWEANPGCGPKVFGKLVGIAGNLFNYSGPDKLKKRLCIHNFQPEGLDHPVSCRMAKQYINRNLRGQDKKDAFKAMGYSGARLSILYGQVMQFHRSDRDGPYHRFFQDEVERKREKTDGDPMWRNKQQAPYGKLPGTFDRLRAHARRVTLQKLVVDLWRVWHGQEARVGLSFDELEAVKNGTPVEVVLA